MSSDSDLTFYSALGFGAGLYVFFKGFREYRKYRVLADTPVVPIRSMAMGLVEVHGKARGAELVPAPVTGTPCLFYKVVIERWERDSKGRGSWHHLRTDEDGLRFYLDDGTGKVLVDARGAELDLIQSGRRETGGASPSWFRNPLSRIPHGGRTPGVSPTDDELRAYVSRVSAGFSNLPATTISKYDTPEVRRAKAQLLAKDVFGSLKQVFGGGGLLRGGGGGSSGRYRLTEYCILPDHWYDVTGTCTENSTPQDEYDRNLLVKGENEPTFLISWRSEKQIEGHLRRRAALYVFGGAVLSIVCLAILLGKLGWL